MVRQELYMKKIIASESRALIANGPIILPTIAQTKSVVTSPLNMTKNLYKTIGTTNSISKQALGQYTSPSSMFNQFNMRDNLQMTANNF
jgi:hypothetical protein